jgi:hypothetical protein
MLVEGLEYLGMDRNRLWDIEEVLGQSTMVESLYVSAPRLDSFKSLIHSQRRDDDET